MARLAALVPLVLLMLLAITSSPVLADDSEDRCQEIVHPLCLDALQYNHTRLPNSFGHSTQSEVARALPQWLADLPSRSACAKNARRFACQTHLPLCSILDIPIPPCRETCQQARRSCAEDLQRLGVQWPRRLSCEDLPFAGRDELCLVSLGEGTAEGDASPGTAEASTEAAPGYTRPASTTGLPATTSSPPVSTSRPPVSTSRPSASTSGPPVSTSRPPASTSSPPLSTTGPTASTSSPPVSTSRPPASTTESATYLDHPSSLWILHALQAQKQEAAQAASVQGNTRVPGNAGGLPGSVQNLLAALPDSVRRLVAGLPERFERLLQLQEDNMTLQKRKLELEVELLRRKVLQ